MGTYQIETEDGVYEIEVDDEASNVPKSFMQEFTDTSKMPGDAWSSLKNTASGLGDMAMMASRGVIENPAMGPLGAIMPLAKSAIQNPGTPGEILQRTASFIPGGNTAVQAGRDWYNDELKPSGEYGAMARRELVENLTTLPLTMAGMKVPGMVKGVGQGVRDSIVWMPQEAILGRTAKRPDIYADKLNAGQGVSNMERNLVSNVGEYHDEFTQYNPTRNIDLENVPPGQEYSRFQQFKENINQDYIAGVTERNNILKEAASKEIELQNKSNAAGVPYDGGAKITEIPESSFDPNGMESGLPLIAKTRPGGEAGVIAARQFVEEQFGVVRDVSADQHLSGMVAAPEGRALSASELNDVRMKVDAQLREKGAWDLNQPPPGINPSALQSEVEALKYYRAQIDSLLKQKLESLIGPDSAKRFDDAGGRIGYAKTYGQLAKRFGEETGQAFTPGSANRAPPGAGIKGTGRKVVDAVVDVLPIKNTRTATEGITREVDQLRQLQRLVEMNTTPGYTPAPRGLAQIKASMKDMMSVENLALSLGLIKAAGDLNRMPEDQARKVIGITAQAFPDAFAPTPDRVNVVDEQYQDPFGKETVVQSTLMSSPEERAMRIGGSYANRYVPQTPKTPQPSLPALPATMEKLSDINSSLEPVFQTKSYAYDAQSPLSELEQLTKPDGFVQ